MMKLIKGDVVIKEQNPLRPTGGHRLDSIQLSGHDFRILLKLPPEKRLEWIDTMSTRFSAHSYHGLS